MMRNLTHTNIVKKTILNLRVWYQINISKNLQLQIHVGGEFFLQNLKSLQCSKNGKNSVPKSKIRGFFLNS